MEVLLHRFKGNSKLLCSLIYLLYNTHGKEPDGTFNEEYCKWCYTDGIFVYTNIDDLIDFCSEHMANENWSSEQVRAYMKDMLPKLNYWKLSNK